MNARRMPDAALPPAKVFRFARLWRAVAPVFCAALFAGGLFLLTSPFRLAHRSTFAVAIFWGFGLGGCALAAYLLLYVYRSRLEILADRIRVVGASHRVWECPFPEIRGYRIVRGQSKYLKLYPTVPTRRPKRIELIFDRQAELLDWVRANLRDLAAEESESEGKEMLSDQRLGISEAQRGEAVRRARLWIAGLNLVALVVAIWAVYDPRPYRYAIGALAALPMLAAAAMRWFRGVVRFSGRPGGAHPNIVLAFAFPAFILALRGFFDWHILDWSAFWTPFLAVAAGLAVWTLFCARAAKKNIGVILGIVVVSLVYSYGLVLHLNCFYDRSRPAVYRSYVEARKASPGRRASYHLTLRPWLNQPITEDVTVPRAIYARHPLGSPVLVVVHSGGLKMEWYYVR